jgi:phospholipase C
VWRWGAILLVLVVLISLSALASPRSKRLPGLAIDASGAALVGIHKIEHVIMVQQENRSFDEYFGTFPGADGIATDGSGHPTACLPDPAHGACAAPYADHADNNGGGPHGAASASADMNGGNMDGFVIAAEEAQRDCTDAANPSCANGPIDVMGYHAASDIPNYWAYASDFVLQDRMFQPNASWSLPEHLFLVSEWSARCSVHNNPSSCTNSLDQREHTPGIFGWTDLTYMLHKSDVSWGYYLTTGREPDCEDDEALSCVAPPQSPTTPGIWNPLPNFDTVKHRGEGRNPSLGVVGRTRQGQQ